MLHMFEEQPKVRELRLCENWGVHGVEYDLSKYMLMSQFLKHENYLMW